MTTQKNMNSMKTKKVLHSAATLYNEQIRPLMECCSNVECCIKTLPKTVQFNIEPEEGAGRSKAILTIFQLIVLNMTGIFRALSSNRNTRLTPSWHMSGIFVNHNVLHRLPPSVL